MVFLEYNSLSVSQFKTVNPLSVAELAVELVVPVSGELLFVPAIRMITNTHACPSPKPYNLEIRCARAKKKEEMQLFLL